MQRILPFRVALSLGAIAAMACGIGLRAGRGAADDVAVSVMTDKRPGRAAEHGLKKLMAALEAKGVTVERVVVDADAASDNIVIAAGLASGSGPAARLVRIVKDFDVPVLKGHEALVIHRINLNGHGPLLVSGSDDRGLMYALLDVADRVGWAEDANDPLSEVRDVAEKPDVVDRALSIYTMHRTYFEQRLFDAKYWDRYFDMLARNRFNRFVIVFGYENGGYMAPMYPYFFDVPGFPDVRVTGLTKEQQKRYLDSLNRLIEQAHDRGIEVTLAPWDHIYRAGVQTGGVRGMDGAKPTPGLVWGVTKENLKEFSVAALKELFKQVPHFDSIQFRMHGESGLKRSEMPEFWKAIYATVKECRPDIRFDARAKNFPDSLIDLALEMGVNIRITTKYWMEQMGLPFHPTHIHPGNQKDRRHGYADLLRYPRRYKMHWRLWNGGTNRVLLWGDPDYARRFAESTHLYDGEGFEVNEPLATKMEAQPHDVDPFELLNPKYRYYDYEFERYWHFYQVFGRLGYNPETPAEVWEKEFERRFGKAAAPYVMRALHQASKILPYAVAYCYPYNHFPTTRGWVARQRQWDLPTFAKSLPSDTEQFLGPDQAARLYLAGEDSAKIWPEQSSAWFRRTANDVLHLIEEAEKRIGGNRNKEFDSTVVDLKVLADLSLYHSWRAMAGKNYAWFKQSQDLAWLQSAISEERRAIEQWEAIVEVAGDVYHNDLMMGLRRSGLAGHWKDELTELRKGLAKLEEEQKRYVPSAPGDSPVIRHVPYRRLYTGGGEHAGSLFYATVSGRHRIDSVQIGYRGAKGRYRFSKMQSTEPPVYSVFVPNSELVQGFRYFIEAKDAAGNRATYPENGKTHPIAVTVSKELEPPVVTHRPLAVAPASKPLSVQARVTDPSGVKWVRLRYRPVTQFEDYRTLEMKRVGGTDRYEAVVPAKHVVPEYDFMYFIEVMDNAGNGMIYPDLAKEAPYVIVKLKR